MSNVKINYSTSDFSIYFDKYNSAGGFAFSRTTFSKNYRKNPGRVETPVAANFQTFARCAPNIVIFMTIDAGFSNKSTFGVPIHTPPMDRLAQG